MKTIKDGSIIFLIFFIVVSILYAIHLFRYEYIDRIGNEGVIIRIDRITNEVCFSLSYINQYELGTDMIYSSPDNLSNKVFSCYLENFEKD